MVEYECENCKKRFLLKGDYMRHINRKFKCQKKVIEMNIIKDKKYSKATPKLEQNTEKEVKEVKEYNCEYCKEVFSRKYNLERHKNGRCEIKKILDENELLKRYIETRKENDELKEKIRKDAKSNGTNKGTINNITNNTNNTNNITNNIVNNNITIQFGLDTKMDRYLTEKDKEIIIRQGCMAISETLKRIYYDKDKPYLHIAYASDKKKNSMMIYDGNKFTIANYKESLNIMIDNSICSVTNIYESDDNNEEIKYKYVKRALDAINSENKEENKCMMDKIEEEVKNEPYRNREMVINTHKNIEKENNTITI